MNFESILKQTLINDIEHCLNGNSNQTDLIGQIILHNGMHIGVQNGDISISCLESLKYRTLMCLKKAKITTLTQLAALSNEEIRKIRNAGPKTYAELIGYVENYRKAKEEVGNQRFVDVVFTLDHIEHHHRFIDKSNKEIAKELFRMYMEKESVFEMGGMSSALKNILILSGHYFYDDIKENSYNIMCELLLMGISTLAYELRNYFNLSEDTPH